MGLVEYKGDAGSGRVEGFDSTVYTVLAPELAAFGAVLSVRIGDDLAAAGATNDLDTAHLVGGLVVLVLLNLWVSYV